MLDYTSTAISIRNIRTRAHANEVVARKWARGSVAKNLINLPLCWLCLSNRKWLWHEKSTPSAVRRTVMSFFCSFSYFQQLLSRAATCTFCCTSHCAFIKTKNVLHQCFSNMLKGSNLVLLLNFYVTINLLRGATSSCKTADYYGSAPLMSSFFSGGKSYKN